MHAHTTPPRKLKLHKESLLVCTVQYPLTSQEIIKYFRDGFLKNPMLYVIHVSSDSSKLKYWNMLKSSTYCTFVEPSPAVFLTLVVHDQSFTDMRLLNCTTIELGKRGLGRLILNTKERAHESDQKAAGPRCRAAARRPIQVAKRGGMYAATLLSALVCTYRESIIMTAPASASGCCCPSCCSVSFLAA